MCHHIYHIIISRCFSLNKTAQFHVIKSYMPCIKFSMFVRTFSLHTLHRCVKTMIMNVRPNINSVAKQDNRIIIIIILSDVANQCNLFKQSRQSSQLKEIESQSCLSLTMFVY